MLLSIAPVVDHAEALTLVVSSPAVNSLRINRSRSTDGARPNCTLMNCPACRTTVPATNPTSVMKTRTVSPARAASARSVLAVSPTPDSDMSLMRPIEIMPLGPMTQIGSSSSKRSSPRRIGACSDIMQTRNSTTTLIDRPERDDRQHVGVSTMRHSGIVLMIRPRIVSPMSPAAVQKIPQRVARRSGCRRPSA